MLKLTSAKILCAAALLMFLTSLAPADPLPKLRVADNGRCFVKSDGTPFFYLGDTEWGLFHLTREDATTYLKDRAAKKFTVIQAVATFWGGIDRTNPYGQTVFLNSDPTKPNDAFFQHVDFCVNTAESLGLYVAIVPIWSKEYVQQDPALIDKPGVEASIRSAIRPQSPSVLDKNSALSYGKFLGQRYRDKAVIWILGGDWLATGTEDIWRSLAAGLAEGDGGSHLKTYHPKSPRSSSQWFQNDPWLDFNMIQSGHTTLNRNYDLVTADYDRVPIKPVVDGEGGYEGIADGLSPGGKIEAADVRRIAYTAVFAGAAGYTYGANGLFGATSRAPTATGRASTGRSAAPARAPAAGRAPAPAASAAASITDEGAANRGPALPWQQALQLPASSQMQYLRALIESRPMLLRIPDQWLLVTDPMGTTTRIQACRASDGSYAFIYTAAGSKMKIRMVDRMYEKLSGTTIRAYWYDPRQGASTLIGEFPKTASKDFTPPSTGIGNDWVLVLDDAAKKFPAPGAHAP